MTTVEEVPQNACYHAAHLIEAIAERPDNEKLATALRVAFPDLSAVEARFKLLGVFEDALEEVSHVPSLSDDHLSSIIGQIREFHHLALLAVAQDKVGGFKVHSKFESAISTLMLIGHTLATSNVVRPTVFDRASFLKEADSMLTDTREAPLNPMQKAVIELKLRSIIRIMHECEGASDEQIRRRLKNIFADIQAEFETIDEEQKEFVEKFKDWVSRSMKSGVFALGLTSDALSILTITGPVAAAALIAAQEQPLMIEGPSDAASVAETSRGPE